jgi:hypothetical protein
MFIFSLSKSTPKKQPASEGKSEGKGKQNKNKIIPVVVIFE